MISAASICGQYDEENDILRANPIVLEAIVKARSVFPSFDFDAVKFRIYDSRGGTTLGLAQHGNGRQIVALAPQTIANKRQLYETTIHELAHLIADKVYHAKMHDYYWGHVMICLGVDPEHLHSAIEQRA